MGISRLLAQRANSLRLQQLSSIASARPETPLTHEVINQVPAFADMNPAKDIALREALSSSKCSEDALLHVLRFGEVSHTASMQEQSRLANEHRPVLQTHDRIGNRVDRVSYTQSYHDLFSFGISNGVSSYAWNTLESGRFATRGALLSLMYNLEPGIVCPMTMTFAAVPVLQRYADPEWAQKAASPVYDPRDVPISEKKGITLGMSMTEKQGGSDVRANTTVAKHIHDNAYTLIGHKWFTSAPMSDGFLTLAQTPDGVSCFLVPRWLPNGDRNKGFNIMRLKAKLGDHSNASSEVEYHNCVGFLLGSPGRGIATILEMVVHTRLDCTIGSAALMRQATQHAVHHCANRQVFGKYLINQPIMEAVLADLAVESEAAMAMWVRCSKAFERSPEEQHFQRLATAVSKYFVCKRAPHMVYEAMECHGGNGYVEDSGPMARLFRQSPLNAIWEGSGNVIALDILRALNKDAEVGEAFCSELEKARGFDSRLDRLLIEIRSLTNEIRSGTFDAASARYLGDKFALALQGSLLVRHGNSKVAEAFIVCRLDENGRGWNVGSHRALSKATETLLISRASLE